MPICTICSRDLPPTAFYRRHNSKRCRDCVHPTTTGTRCPICDTLEGNLRVHLRRFHNQEAATYPLTDDPDGLTTRILQGRKPVDVNYNWPRTPLVYFLQAGEAGRPIKIGFTRDMKKRLGKMMTLIPDCPAVLHTEGGSEELERELHERFKNERLHGEWFAPSPKLLKHISTLQESQDAALNSSVLFQSYLVEHHIYSYGQWRHHRFHTNEADRFPLNPNLYSDWPGWHALPGYHTRRPTVPYFTYEEAQAYAQKVGITSSTDWRQRYVEGSLDPRCPSAPNSKYSDQWRDWQQFLRS